MLDDLIRSAANKVGILQGMHYSITVNDAGDSWCVVTPKGGPEQRQETCRKMKEALEGIGFVVTMGEDDTEAESFGVRRNPQGLDSELPSL